MGIINNVAKAALVLAVLTWFVCLAGSVFGFANDFMITYLFLLWIPAVSFFTMIEEITNKED